MRKFEFPGGAKDVTGWAMAHPVYDLKKALLLTLSSNLFHVKNASFVILVVGDIVRHMPENIMNDEEYFGDDKNTEKDVRCYW